MQSLVFANVVVGVDHEGHLPKVAEDGYGKENRYERYRVAGDVN